MWRIGFVGLIATLMASTPSHAQTGRIAGRVTGADGSPVAGAQVRVLGSNLGTLTRDDGRYAIGSVPAGTYTVRATRIGFAPDSSRGVVVSPDAEATVDFRLQPRAASLTAVTVVGYGQQRGPGGTCAAGGGRRPRPGGPSWFRASWGRATSPGPRPPWTRRRSTPAGSSAPRD